MRSTHLTSLFAATLLILSANPSRAGFLDDVLGKVKSADSTTAAGGGLASLTQDQMIQGLKGALGNGLQHAVGTLGHDGGYLANPKVKIPMPEKLQTVEKTMRALGQDKMADDFINTMNHAAEQAVPVAASVFVDALSQMSIDDARGILTGPDDSATQYFHRTTQAALYAKFYPIVKDATGRTGATAAYKNLMDKASAAGSFGGLGGAFGGFVKQESFDVDDYVTNKALDGLFLMVAEEEKNIRQNPVARTTDILKTVFGSLKQ